MPDATDATAGILVRLRNALADAYDEPARAREIAERAGISRNQQPIDQPDMRGWWWETLRIAWRQQRLIALFDVAATDPTAHALRDRFEALRGPVAELQAQSAPSDEEPAFRGLPRLNYRKDVESIVAFHVATFVGREAEQARIIAFAGQEAPGYELIEAPAGYGKTALMAQLIERQQRGEWDGTPLPQLAYFLIRSEGGRNTPDAFLQAINSQLLDLLGLPGGVPSDLPSLRTQFSQLWPRAVAGATAERPLLLLVDALDEISADVVTVADLLPAGLVPHVHVVISSRPNPEARQRAALEHPLRHAELLSLGGFTEAEIRQLLVDRGVETTRAAALAPEVLRLTGGEPLFARFVAQDVAAKGETALVDLAARPPGGVEEYFRDQLDKLREAAGEANLIWEVLGYLTAALGGLTAGELAEVLETPQRKVSAALRPVERYLLPGERLELMHLQLRKVLEEDIGKAELRQRRAVLLDWCRSYQDRGWPDETPEYVLAHAAEHFRQAGDRERVYGLVDRRLMALKRARTGAHRSFSADVALAFDLAAAETPVRWVELIRAALVRTTLAELAAQLPAEVLSAMVRLGWVQEALDQASLIVDPGKRCTAYLAIGRASLVTDRRDDAEAAFAIARAAAASIGDDKVRDKSLVALVEALAEPENAAAALAVAAEIGDYYVRGVALADLAKALGQANDVAAARRALIAVGDAAAGISRYARTQVLTAVAQSLAQVGDAKNAIATANRIEAGNDSLPVLKSWMPDYGSGRVDALLGVWAVLAQTGGTETASEALATACLTAEGIKDHFRSANAFLKIAHALTEAGDRSAAREALAAGLAVAEEIEETRRRNWVLAAIATALARTGDAGTAIAAADKVRDFDHRSQLLDPWGHDFVSTGEDIQDREWESRIWYSHDMSARDWMFSRDQVLFDVAEILAGLGDAIGARTAIGGIRNTNLRTEAEATLTRAIQHAKEASSAQLALWATEDVSAGVETPAVAARELIRAEVVAAAIAAAEGIGEDDALGELLAALAVALARNGHWEAACTAAEGIESSYARARALAAVAQALLQLGDFEAARKVSTICSVVAERIPYDSPRSEVLSSLIPILIQIDDVEIARELVASISDGYFRALALPAVAQALAEAEEDKVACTIMSDARASAKGILHAPDRVQASIAVGEALARAGDDETASEELLHARSAAEGMEDHRFCAEMLVAVARAFTHVGEFQFARETLAGARERSAKMSRVRDRVQVLCTIADALAELRDADTARKTLASAYALSKEGLDTLDRVQALSVIAKASVRAADIEAASEGLAIARMTAEGIKDRFERAMALIDLAHALEETGDRSAARTVLTAAHSTTEGIGQNHYRARALATVALGLVQAGETNRAADALRGAVAASVGAGRGETLHALAVGSGALTAIAGPEMLRRVAETVIEVESWWARPR